MPTYVYHCPAGHEFERFERKISDKSRAKCPECGKMATRVVSGGTGFLLKGSGFYATDYKKGDEKGEKGEKMEKKTEGKGTEDKAGKQETKGDSPGSRKSSGADT